MHDTRSIRVITHDLGFRIDPEGFGVLAVPGTSMVMKVVPRNSTKPCTVPAESM